MSEPPRFRTELRVTKYDPALRVGGRGGFTGDDWTSLSDVGRTFAGEALTLEGYLDVEARHLQVVAVFLDEARVETMVVRDPEGYDARWWPGDGDRVNTLEAVDLVREMLRERGFCRLEGDNGAYLHVGYDYYVYLGGDVPSDRTVLAARRLGLHADVAFVSPYTDADGDESA